MNQIPIAIWIMYPTQVARPALSTPSATAWDLDRKTRPWCSARLPSAPKHLSHTSARIKARRSGPLLFSINSQIPGGVVVPGLVLCGGVGGLLLGGFSLRGLGAGRLGAGGVVAGVVGGGFVVPGWFVPGVVSGVGLVGVVSGVGCVGAVSVVGLVGVVSGVGVVGVVCGAVAG